MFGESRLQLRWDFMDVNKWILRLCGFRRVQCVNHTHCRLFCLTLFIVAESLSCAYFYIHIYIYIYIYVCVFVSLAVVFQIMLSSLQICGVDVFQIMPSSLQICSADVFQILPSSLYICTGCT